MNEELAISDSSGGGVGPHRMDDWFAGKLTREESIAMEKWMEESEAVSEDLDVDDFEEHLVGLPQNRKNDANLTALIGIVSGEIGTQKERHSNPHAWKGVLAPSDEEGVLGTIGDYEVVELIAIGGMGIVFKARDPELDRIAALKVLDPGLATNQIARTRFLREARAAAKLEHDHILPIYGVHEDVVPYFAMRYADGGTLQQRLDEGYDFSFEQVKSILHQVSSALAGAHQQNLVHRDIKPANIVFAADSDRLWVCDFGIAQSTEDPSLTYPGAIAGTPQYMSPEQAIGAEIDARSDLYSLGAVIYQCAYGEPLHSGDTTVSVLQNIAGAGERAKFPKGKKQCPRWFRRLLSRLISHNREDRPADAGEVISAIKEEYSPVPKRYQRRVRKALIGAAIVSAILLLGGGLLSSNSFRFELNSRLAERQGHAFFLSDRIGVYYRFATAVAESKAGSTIYLPEEEIRIDNVRIPAGKNLKLRPANPDSYCLITTSIAGAPGIVTSSPLEIDGVDLEVCAKRNGEAVLVSEGANITIRNSQFTARGNLGYSEDGWNQAAVSLRSGASLRLVDCDLRLPNLDAVHSSMIDTEIELTDSRIEAYYGIRFSDSEQSNRLSVQMENIDFSGRSWVKAEVGHDPPELAMVTNGGTFVTSGPLGWIQSTKKISPGVKMRLEGANNRWLPGNNVIVVGKSGDLRDADELHWISGIGKNDEEEEKPGIRLESDGREFTNFTEAFEEMPDGGTLLLSGPLYVAEEISAPKKEIHLRAAEGARPVVIAGASDGHALFFYRHTTVKGIRFVRLDEKINARPILGFRAPESEVLIEDCVFDSGRTGFKDARSRSSVLGVTSTKSVVVRRCLLTGGKCFVASIQDEGVDDSRMSFEDSVFIGNRAFDLFNDYDSSGLTMEIDRCVFVTLCFGRFHPANHKDKEFPVRWRVDRSVLDIRDALISTYDQKGDALLRNLSWSGAGNWIRKDVTGMSLGRFRVPVSELDIPENLSVGELFQAIGAESSGLRALENPVDKEELNAPVTMGQLGRALDPSLQEEFKKVIGEIGAAYRVR